MTRIFKSIIFVVALTLPLIVMSGCTAVRDITKALTDIKNLQFKLMDVSQFGLAGIRLDDKKDVSSFSIADGLKLTNAFSSKKLPARFIINLGAKNPNSTESKNSSNSSLTLEGLEFRLLIDGVSTITGNIMNPVKVPSGGNETIIPIAIDLDLYDFFGNQGYDRLLRTALAIGGVEGSAAKLELDAQPTVSTPIGRIKSPRINIVSKEWR